MNDMQNSSESSNPTSANIFAKYAYQGPSDKTTRLRKRTSEQSHEQELNGGEPSTPGGPQPSQGPATKDKRSKKVKIYHHLKEIDDHLEIGLDVIFCGINPGEQSSQTGHHYSNPTNHFWSCLYTSGFTSRKLDPREDYKLPKSFSIGLTNLVDRPSVEESELSKTEQVAGVSRLLQKISVFKPHIVCFVGLGIAEVVRANCGLAQASKTPKVKAEVGVQSYKMVHETAASETIFFAVSSTSGRVVRYTKSDKIQQFKDVRALLEQVKKQEYDSSHLAPITMPLAND